MTFLRHILGTQAGEMLKCNLRAQVGSLALAKTLDFSIVTALWGRRQEDPWGSWQLIKSNQGVSLRHPVTNIRHEFEGEQGGKGET